MDDDDVPERSDVDLPAVFAALGDATRRAVVERLCIGPATVSELAAPFDMALPSFMHHLAVLERAGLITTHKTGRTRSAQLDSATLAAGRDWFASLGNHWERRLDQLDALFAVPDPRDPSTKET